MIFEDACLILELPSNFNSQQLKHNYYSLALKYHPDKNYDIDATSKFQTIQAAYNYLSQGGQAKDANDVKDAKDAKDAKEANEETETKYSDFVKIVLESIINKKIYNEKIINLLTLKCNELTIAFLTTLPKHTILDLHAIITNYSKLLNIFPDILDKINTIKESMDTSTTSNNEEIKILLTPSLTNLLNGDLHKYIHCGEELYVPYWHHELVYDLSKCTLIFKCEPSLPDFITIDKFNNLYITITINIHDIINFKTIDISIGNKKYAIPTNELKIAKQQIYSIKKQGVPLINTKKIYTITLKADIHFIIVFKDILI